MLICFQSICALLHINKIFEVSTSETLCEQVSLLELDILEKVPCYSFNCNTYGVACFGSFLKPRENASVIGLFKFMTGGFFHIWGSGICLWIGKFPFYLSYIFGWHGVWIVRWKHKKELLNLSDEKCKKISRDLQLQLSLSFVRHHMNYWLLSFSYLLDERKESKKIAPSLWQYHYMLNLICE